MTEIASRMIPTAPPALVILAKPSVRDPVLTDSTIHPVPLDHDAPLSLAPITCKQHEILFPAWTRLHLQQH